MILKYDEIKIGESVDHIIKGNIIFVESIKEHTLKIWYAEENKVFSDGEKE